MSFAQNPNSSFNFLNGALTFPSPEQLLSSREALLDGLPVPLLVAGEQDRVLYVNRAFASLMGCAQDYPLGKEISSLLLPQAGPTVELTLPVVAIPGGAGQGQTGDFTLLKPDGTSIPVQQVTNSITWEGRRLTLLTLFDLTEQRATNERLLRIAYYDSLTGLPNRDCFIDSMTQELRHISEDEGYSFSVMLLNMDRFKMLNEQFGSDVADKVLIEVTERTKTILHGFATIFRTGGDEIAAILKGVSSRDYVDSALARLQKLISIPVWINGDSVFPSACITAMLNIPKEFSALQVLGRLSGAMKVAKKRGLGYVLFVPPTAGEAEAQGSQPDISAEIQASLLKSQFIPYFQPIYNTSTMTLLGFETLARWQHPDSGVLPPSDFLSEAEESGLVTAIDKTIVSQSIAAMEEFIKKHPEVPFYVSANASGLSLRDPSFFAFLETELRKASFPADRFVLEITEDILIENLAEARSYLENLKKLNIRVALDDFGTGYSSLQYISELPIDSLKIDRSFIDQLLKSRKTLSLVKSVIEMARGLDLNIVAEGIETKDQNQWLAEFGVDGQGYFFSPPLSMERTDEFLKDASAFAAIFGGQTPEDAQG